MGLTGPTGPQGPQGPPGTDPGHLTGLMGFAYSSVSSVPGFPSGNPSCGDNVPRDDNAHALAVPFTVTSSAEAFLVFFSYGASNAYLCNTAAPVAFYPVQVEVQSTGSTLFFPAQIVAACGQLAASASVLVTGLSAGSYTAQLCTLSGLLYNGPRHVTMYRVQ